VNVEYTRRALIYVSDFYDHVATQDQNVAFAMEKAIRRACSDLAFFPFANPSTDSVDVYRMQLRKYKITVFYRIRRRLAVVQILRVVRGSRVRNLRRVPRA
jgi:plasmid stabilization system protein ParE